MLSTSQLPKGTSCLTHSTLRSFHVMLVGSSIQVVYETIAHNSSARKGAAINLRRRRRLRPAAASRRCAWRASTRASGAETGDGSDTSGRALSPRPGADRCRPSRRQRPKLDRARHDKGKIPRSPQSHVRFRLARTAARSAGGGARRSCRRRPASPPTRGVRGAGSLRPASTTTRTPARRGYLAYRRSGGWAPCAGLVPAMEARTIPRVPGLAQARGAEVPVGANLTGNGAQVAPEVNDRWAPPEPVAVVDAVDDQAGLQNERVRDHRIVLRIGVLLDVEVLLDDAPRVGEEGPLRAE